MEVQSRQEIQSPHSTQILHAIWPAVCAWRHSGEIEEGKKIVWLARLSTALPFTCIVWPFLPQDFCAEKNSSIPESLWATDHLPKNLRSLGTCLANIPHIFSNLWVFAPNQDGVGHRVNILIFSNISLSPVRTWFFFVTMATLFYISSKLQSVRKIMYLDIGRSQSVQKESTCRCNFHVSKPDIQVPLLHITSWFVIAVRYSSDKGESNSYFKFK